MIKIKQIFALVFSKQPYNFFDFMKTKWLQFVPIPVSHIPTYLLQSTQES